MLSVSASLRRCSLQVYSALSEYAAHENHKPTHSLRDTANQDSSEHTKHDDAELTLQIMSEKGQLALSVRYLWSLDRPPSIKAYLSLLRACCKSKHLHVALEVYSNLLFQNVCITGFLGDYLVLTLAKCGAVDDAVWLSATLPQLTVFSCTAIISAYGDCGRGREALQMYKRMEKDGIDPDSFTFVSLFKACGSIPDLEQGKEIHTHAQSKHLSSHNYVGNTIVNMYGKCGAIVDAEEAFISLSYRDTVSWNGMLSAYVENGEFTKSILLYRQMQGEGMKPDEATLVIMLQACGNLAEEEDDSESSKTHVWNEIGQALHACAWRHSYVSNVLVGTSILSMYGKCGKLPEAENMFIVLEHRDTVAWNAMLSAYVEAEQVDRALSLYVHMRRHGVSPDHLTYVILLQACSVLSEKDGTLTQGKSNCEVCFEIGRALHAEVKEKGYAACVLVVNTLINMYGKCGFVKYAEEVFNQSTELDIVTWNVMLSALAENAHGDKALLFFRKMQLSHLILNEVTLMSILQACSETGRLEVCRNLHSDIITNGLDNMLHLIACLVTAYGSCGSSVDACVTFDDITEPNIVTWNACISCHTLDGNTIETLYMFENLKLLGIKPDKVSLISVLSACSHSGFLSTGIEYFHSMDMEISERRHYNILIDMYGRAGDFRKIENIYKKMPVKPDLTIWLSILGACCVHNNSELAKEAFQQAVHLYPEHPSTYVLMSNICADVHSIMEESVYYCERSINSN